MIETVVAEMPARCPDCPPGIYAALMWEIDIHDGSAGAECPCCGQWWEATPTSYRVEKVEA